MVWYCGGLKRAARERVKETELNQLRYAGFRWFCTEGGEREGGGAMRRSKREEEE